MGAKVSERRGSQIQMNKNIQRLLNITLVAVMLPFLVPVIQAASTYVGSLVQPVSQSGSWNVTLNNGSNNVGTVNGSTVAVTNVNGANLNVSVQNSPTVSITASTMAVTNVNGQNLNVAIAGALAAGTNSIGATYLPQVTVPTLSSQTVSGSSVQIFASDSNRRNFEIYALPSNTDYVVCRWASTPAVSTDTIVIMPSNNYTASGSVPTSAFSCIANSGSQVIRGTSWAP